MQAHPSVPQCKHTIPQFLQAHSSMQAHPNQYQQITSFSLRVAYNPAAQATASISHLTPSALHHTCIIRCRVRAWKSDKDFCCDTHKLEAGSYLGDEPAHVGIP
eukprot:1161997-Pelagomonas_calceolata.AAC.12